IYSKIIEEESLKTLKEALNRKNFIDIESNLNCNNISNKNTILLPIVDTTLKGALKNLGYEVVDKEEIRKNPQVLVFLKDKLKSEGFYLIERDDVFKNQFTGKSEINLF